LSVWWVVGGWWLCTINEPAEIVVVRLLALFLCFFFMFFFFGFLVFRQREGMRLLQHQPSCPFLISKKTVVLPQPTPFCEKKPTPLLSPERGGEEFKKSPALPMQEKKIGPESRNQNSEKTKRNQTKRC
jgi:hypothetical protein